MTSGSLTQLQGVGDSKYQPPPSVYKVLNEKKNWRCKHLFIFKIHELFYSYYK